MTLIEWATREQIDYSALRNRCTVNLSKNKWDEDIDISVIIPVRGRTEYHKIITKHFFDAMVAFKGKVSLTFVEHDNMPPKHYWLKKNWANHIFIPADGKPFNKCLCHNIGVLYGPRANFYLFHDTDLIVPEQFFNMLIQNMVNREAVQAFTQRRVLMVAQTFSRQIIDGEREPNFYSYSSHDVRPAIPGAPGGSIFVSKNLLLEVGMWEDCFFTGYSVEDQFFFNKLMLSNKFGFCDNPAIEVMHLWHPSCHQVETCNQDFVALDIFDGMNEAEKRAYMQSRKEHFLNYFK